MVYIHDWIRVPDLPAEISTLQESKKEGIMWKTVSCS